MATDGSHRITWLEVDLEAIKQNLAHIRAAVAPAGLMAMVKANAYGHGVELVAPYIEATVDYFGVALPDEGVELRRLGIRKPVLVCGGVLPQQLPLFVKHDLSLTVISMSLLQEAEEFAVAQGIRLRVHLKIDTGMERLGVHDYDAEPFLEAALHCPHLDVEGIYTHLANGERPDARDSGMQLQRFEGVLRSYEQRAGRVPALRHVCNSGGILHLPAGHLDMVRPGLLMYGVYPARDARRTLEVRPALRWRSRVVLSKMTRAGRPVSYGSTWQPTADTGIVTIPCGYADGYSRRMSAKSRVSIGGTYYPQVGRICMDQFMVDVSDDPVAEGAVVSLLGDGITVEDLAAWSGTNAYEVLTSISTRVPRCAAPSGDPPLD